MMREKSRRPSPLQRRVLIVLAALDAKRPGRWRRGILSGCWSRAGTPVYGPNLRASCRRMEAAGWLRTLRAPNLQLAVELTEAVAGRRSPRTGARPAENDDDVRVCPLGGLESDSR
jgi:hypothetical protein